MSINWRTASAASRRWITLVSANFNSETLLAAVQAAEPGTGVNVMKGSELVNMIDAGVIDPVNVTKEVISSSISIAGTGITIGASMVEEANE